MRDAPRNRSERDPASPVAAPEHEIDPASPLAAPEREIDRTVLPVAEQSYPPITELDARQRQSPAAVRGEGAERCA